MPKKPVAFYSRADENYVSGTIKDLMVGNTEIASDIIKELCGADIFKIEQEKPYSKKYNDCINEAKADRRANARSKLKSNLESIDDYDTIYLGFPNYWGTMPMAVFTFLESFDFSGKTVIPFCTSASSGLSNGGEKLEKIAGTGEWLQGKRFSSNASESEVNKWAMSFNKKQKV